VNQSSSSPNVLVAPLDWGLGHATRCVPVIRELLHQRCRVILAASGKGKAVLQQEFPSLPFLDLPGYEIEYAATGWGLAIKIVAQIPKLLSAINDEQAWLQKVVKDEGIDAVISDNRFGLHHPDVRTVFITHQLCIQTPFGWGKELLQELNYNYINKFNECWVPDAEGESNLAGELSHPEVKPAIPLQYTGLLSRFEKKHLKTEKKYLLILLSGPEPQRTMLEEKITAELKDYTKPFVLVRGLPATTEALTLKENGIVYNHLPAEELEQVIAGASFVIGRCGYSTVMDLAAMQKRSILIPTPGQTEQEYLARHLMQKNLVFFVEQKKFKLKNALSLAENFPYQLHQPVENRLSFIVEAFLNKTIQAKEKKAKGSAQFL
jgi:UDP:flavonoid glycosyltransferase YjiC (YdhE family)